jgi:anti-sigma regulatory factor (Ser/Thr protein kinase)
MRAGGRSLVLAATILLLGVVVLSLAVMTVVAFPVALAFEVGLLVLVVGLGARVKRKSEQRRAQGLSPFRRGYRERDGTGIEAQVQPSGPRWATQWESRPPVDAVPLARSRLSMVLGDWDLADQAGEDILLVVTELLSNAVEHGRGPVQLSVEFRGESVQVDVHDAAPDPPHPLPRDPHRARGRGLQVVEALSSKWGWTNDPLGKTVWAEVPNV